MYRLFIFIAMAVISGCQSKGKDAVVDARPLYHFSPDSNWINDPNGLVFYNGEYHLFYQYNPFGNKWGHMSWAHSVSTDLLHWNKLPVALYEERNRHNADTTMIFSGSAVVDSNNTSGFGTLANPAMVAVYTSFVHNKLKGKEQHQSIAYSTDKGRSWTKYAGNPVLDIQSLEFRDPKVFWYAPQNKWLMVVAKPDTHEVLFYDSKNLKNWNFKSRWGKAGDTSKVWECPDLFEMNVVGTTEKKWVLLLSAGHPDSGYVGMQYFTGNFDGSSFTPDSNQPLPNYLDFGKDFYAAVSYNNTPDQRRIIVGWLNNWAYANEIPTGNVWRGSFSVPRQLQLKQSANGYVLHQQPIQELQKLRAQAYALKQQAVDSVFRLPFTGTSYEMELTLTPQTAAKSGLRLLKSGEEATVLSFDALRQQFLLDRTRSGNVSFHPTFSSIEKAPLSLKNGKLTLRILVDRSIVEVFLQDGATTLTSLVFPIKQDGQIELFAEGGQALFSDLTIWNMKL